jgi:NADPH-dependent curcumin reductase CurA
MQAQAIVLAKRPSGRLETSDFAEAVLALADIKDGEVLIAARYLSIDPYLRGLLDEEPFVGQPVAVGGVVAGRGIGEVLQSASRALKAGDLVFGELSWQSHSVQSAAALRPVMQNGHPVTWQLGVLGIPGITAWLALDRIASPREGEAVVVSSAAGTVGSAAGQIAKALGCRTIGIAGGVQKTAMLRDELGFDDAIDYRGAGDLTQAVSTRLPDGADIYFDNVGGPMLDAMLPVMRPMGRIVICGYMSGYETSGEATALHNHRLISFRRLRVEGFSVRDHIPDHAKAAQALLKLADTRQLRQIETICEGVSAAPKALVGLLRGEMIGKVIVSCVS